MKNDDQNNLTGTDPVSVTPDQGATPNSTNTTVSDANPTASQSETLSQMSTPAQDPMPFTPPTLSPTEQTPPQTVNSTGGDSVLSPSTQQNSTPDTPVGTVVGSAATSHVPKKYGGGKVIATIFGVLLIAGATVAGVSVVQNQQLRTGFAWDCSTYNFEVSQTGDVKILNGSTRNEPAQQAKVYINNALVTTFSVPYLAHGSSADLGHVDVPTSAGFTWKVVGTVDCEDTGSYSPQNTPTPSTVPTLTVTPNITATPIPTLTVTPTQPATNDKCKVELDSPDTAVCWHEPKTNVPMGWTITSLPTTGGPYYLQTDWYVVKPTLGPHHYEKVGPVTVGQKGTIYADWPGVQPNQTDISENHYGLNVVDAQGNPIFSDCSDGMDYYWTQYVCPLPTPTTTTQNVAQCSSVVAYDIDWNELNIQTLSQLKSGQTIYLTVTGNASSGSFDKAQFTINGSLQTETTNLKPGSTNIFYQEYTIPSGQSTFTVGARIHHIDLGWI